MAMAITKMLHTREFADDDIGLLELQHTATFRPRERLVSDTGIAVTRDDAIIVDSSAGAFRDTHLNLLRTNVSLSSGFCRPVAAARRPFIKVSMVPTRDFADDEIGLLDVFPDKQRREEMLELRHAAARLQHRSLVMGMGIAVTRDGAIIPGEMRQNPLQKNDVALFHDIVLALPEHSPDTILPIVPSKLSAFPVTRSSNFTKTQDEQVPFLRADDYLDLNAHYIQVNKPSFRKRKFTAGQNAQPLAGRHRPNTFGLDYPPALWKPIEVAPPLQYSWEAYLGPPMQQAVPDTYVLVACTKCVEAAHRLEHEKLHGKGTTTFPYTALAPSDLLEACRIDGVWKPGVGALVRDVLIEVQVMGGVPVINAATLEQRLLPFLSWQEHRWDDGSAPGGLSPERVADLLYNNGPCIGVLWVISPWYHRVNADRNDAQVYTTGGCGRSDDIRRLSEDLFDGQAGWHAVACIGYRFGGNHVMVLDNHEATGPRRWIHVKEFHSIYPLRV